MTNKQTGMVQGLKVFFGIFMVLVYLGMAVLMAMNYFEFPRYLSWFFAVMFGAYGIYRGYREIKGEHLYGMRRYDDDEQSYTTYDKRLNNLEENNDDEKK